MRVTVSIKMKAHYLKSYLTMEHTHRTTIYEPDMAALQVIIVYQSIGCLTDILTDMIFSYTIS